MAKRTVDLITDISMTVSDLLISTGFSKEMSFEIVGIMQNAVEKYSSNLRKSSRCESKDWRPQQILENDILSDICDKYSNTFTPNEAIKIQTIIRACFKDYYFRERNFEIKVRA